MELVEIERGGVNWIGLAQDKDKYIVLVNAIKNLGVP
jgi:hypothetical protein